jgi:diguanylate cyclase
MIARYGGEEFALILTSTPGENAEPVAERMRSGLEQRPVAFADGQMLRVTMSLGYASLQKGDTPKSLIERADAALYRAKAAGRNRVSA